MICFCLLSCKVFRVDLYMDFFSEIWESVSGAIVRVLQALLEERYWHCWKVVTVVNTLRPRQHERHFADDIFRCLFLNENVSIPIKISLKFVPKGPINNFPTLVQVMAWRRPGDKPLSEPMLVSLSTRICVTRPQWVNATMVLELLK